MAQNWRQVIARNITEPLPLLPNTSVKELRWVDKTLLITWWCHQLETFSALLVICAGNSPVPGDFPARRPVMQSFDAFFDLRLNKRLSKHSWGCWYETLSRPLWRHCNERVGNNLYWMRHDDCSYINDNTRKGFTALMSLYSVLMKKYPYGTSSWKTNAWLTRELLKVPCTRSWY